ncbi:MAG: hypothetical protein ABI238_01755 [Terrimesophilobacter sp.]
MGAPLFRIAGSTAAAIVLVSMLAGCGGTPAPAPSNSVLPSPSPSTSAGPSINPSADILFTITANVRAVDGRTIGVSMAAHAPLASTDPAAADLRTKFLSVCSAGTGAQPITDQYLSDNGSTLMGIDLASTAPGLAFATPINLFFGSPYFAQAAIGNGITPAPGGQTCFSGFSWSKSGEAHGVGDFENSDGVPDLNQWHFGRFGFSVDPSSGATIEACKVTITEAGMKNGTGAAPGWNPAGAGDGISCMIGYVGE